MRKFVADCGRHGGDRPIYHLGSPIVPMLKDIQHTEHVPVLSLSALAASHVESGPDPLSEGGMVERHPWCRTCKSHIRTVAFKTLIWEDHQPVLDFHGQNKETMITPCIFSASLENRKRLEAPGVRRISYWREPFRCRPCRFGACAAFSQSSYSYCVWRNSYEELWDELSSRGQEVGVTAAPCVLSASLSK